MSIIRDCPNRQPDLGLPSPDEESMAAPKLLNSIQENGGSIDGEDASCKDGNNSNETDGDSGDSAELGAADSPLHSGEATTSASAASSNAKNAVPEPTTNELSAMLAHTSVGSVQCPKSASPVSTSATDDHDLQHSPLPLMRPNYVTTTELPAVQQPILAAELMIFNDHIGRIIGRKGKTIADIQQRTGAKVEIPVCCDAGTDFRRVKVIGTAAAVEYCTVLIKMQIPSDNTFELANLQHAVQMLHDKYATPVRLLVIEVPMQHVGRIIGRKGQYLQYLKELTGATVTLPRLPMVADHFGVVQQIFTILGDPAQVAHCEHVLRQKIYECTAEPVPLSRRHKEKNSTVNAAEDTIRQQASQHPSNLCERAAPPASEIHILDVPRALIGRVIGRQGWQIKELQRLSGATIVLPNMASMGDTDSTELHIHGALEQRDRCFNLLLQKMPQLETAPVKTVATSAQVSSHHVGASEFQQPGGALHAKPKPPVMHPGVYMMPMGYHCGVNAAHRGLYEYTNYGMVPTASAEVFPSQYPAYSEYFYAPYTEYSDVMRPMLHVQRQPGQLLQQNPGVPPPTSIAQPTPTALNAPDSDSTSHAT